MFLGSREGEDKLRKIETAVEKGSSRPFYKSIVNFFRSNFLPVDERATKGDTMLYPFFKLKEELQATILINSATDLSSEG